MTASDLRTRVQNDMKDSMRNKDALRLNTVRMLLAAIKQREIDSQNKLSEDEILACIEKLIKQRRDSITQFEAANRHDLAEKEAAEIAVLQIYLPQQLSASEIESILTQAVTDSGASSIKDMGKVMALVKSKVQGRADMEQISARVTTLLTA